MIETVFINRFKLCRTLLLEMRIQKAPVALGLFFKFWNIDERKSVFNLRTFTNIMVGYFYAHGLGAEIAIFDRPKTFKYSNKINFNRSWKSLNIDTGIKV